MSVHDAQLHSLCASCFAYQTKSCGGGDGVKQPLKRLWAAASVCSRLLKAKIRTHQGFAQYSRYHPHQGSETA